MKNQLKFLQILFIVCAFSMCSDSTGTGEAIVLDSAKAITTFSFASPAATGIVTEATHSIVITVPAGTSLTALVPTITHTGTSIDPATGVAHNFTSAATYTVTAENSSQQAYTVRVYKIVPLFKTKQTVSIGTGDDGDLEVGLVWPSPRFSSNTTNTVIDNLTGLVWLKSPDSTLRDWSTASTFADGYTIDGFTDWRLPNINELESISNSGISFPTQIPAWLNANGFLNIQVGAYWTGTTYAADTTCAWYTDNTMRLGKALKTSAGLYTWIVRGDASNIVKTGQTASFTTGDDGDLEKGCPLQVSDRFVVTGNTIKDNVTGLIWEKTPLNTTRTFSQALTYANNLEIDGFTDWRLPNKKELRSLFDYEQANFISYLTAAGFSNIQSGYYWTSTYYESSGGDKGYIIDFSNISTLGIGAVLNNYWSSAVYVIAVRG